jgi:phosphohistidine phosphatase
MGEARNVELYLIRHADALPLGEGGIADDAERPLSEEGQKQAKQIAAGLQRRGVKLDLLLTSPLARARQTADPLAGAKPSLAAKLEECSLLAPGLKPRKLSKALAETGKAVLGLVGHQPDLGEYAAWLLGSKKVQIDLAKAGVAYLKCPEGPEKGAGRLVWLVTPEWLG